MKAIFAFISVFLFHSFAGLAAVEVQEVRSQGGIQAWLIEERSIPFTALELRFRGGTSLDREGKRGEINLMTALIEEGAGDLDSQEFSKARDRLAASFEFDAYLDSVAISVRFLSDNKDEAIALLKKALVQTRFDEDAIERVKSQVRSIIDSDANDPSAIASNAFYNDAFGNHPYGTNSNGTLESVNQLTRSDMFAARDRALTKDNLFVSAVGDISADELGEILDQLLGDLPKSGPSLEGYATPNLNGETSVIAFDTPQSVIMFGHESIARDDPDFIAAYVASEIMGGSGESILRQEVREKRGLTYGIGSFLSPLDHSSLLLGRFSSGNEVAAQAVQVVKEEWGKFAQNGATQAQLDIAKTYLTGAYPLRFDGNSRIARILAGMQMDGYSTDYFKIRNDLVNAVTLEDLNRVIKRVYAPEKLTFVIVGRPEGL